MLSDFLLGSRTKQEYVFSPFLFKIVLTILANTISQEKNKKKNIQIGKEEIKLYLFADDMVLYIENPNVYTQTHPNPIRADKKVQQGYRIQYPV